MTGIFIYLTELKSNGRAARKTAYILPEDVEGSRLMSSVYQSIYQRVGIPMEVFSKAEDGLHWLKQP